MPILPENKDRYPANWPEIRRQVRAAGRKSLLRQEIEKQQTRLKFERKKMKNETKPKSCFEIDILSEPDGRVSMNRFTFGMLIGKLPEPVSPNLVMRCERELRRELDRVFIEAYKEL